MVLLDPLRLIAAMVVVVYHFTASPSAARYWGRDPFEMFPALTAVSRYGWLAVEVFFVISGFVIVRSARGKRLRGFVASRAARLLPAYWACVALTLLLRSVWDVERRPGPIAGLLNFTMVQGLVGVPSVQVVFWTLLVELKFYVLIGFLIRFGGLSDRRLITLALAWPIFAVGVDMLLEASSGGAAQVLLSSLAGLLVPQYASLFAVGIIIEVLTRRPAVPFAWVVLVVDVGLVSRSVLGAAGDATELQGVVVEPGVSLMIVLCATGLVAAAALIHAPAALLRPAAVLGALSYPLYLVHAEFGFAIIDRSSAGSSPWVTLATAVGVVTTLAALLHHLVERRSAPALRRLIAEPDAFASRWARRATRHHRRLAAARDEPPALAAGRDAA